MSVRVCLLWGTVMWMSGWLLSACSGAKSALSLLEKQKYAQVQEKLSKMVEKDSLPIGAYYAYSLLYTDSAFSDYHIDTAYQYIQQAIAGYPQLEEKRQEKLYKQLLLDTTRLQQQKLRIDSLAYARATDEPGIQAYQRFINDFASAPQVSQAIINRNQLVFDSIQQINTYPAYKYFMEKYPDAEQFSLAQQRYNTLAFQELTQEGNLNSYLNFLEDYPTSPYRPQAEQAIFEISTAGNQLESYAAFAQQYPRSAPARKAVNTLYHLYKSSYAPNNFLQDFPGLPYADSLRQAIRIESRSLAPALDGEHYGFIDEQGRNMIAARYDDLPAPYLCEGVLADFIHAGILKSDQLCHEVLTKAGVLVFSFTEPYDSSGVSMNEAVIDQGAGLLEVTIGNQLTLRHKAGHQLISEFEKVEEIELIPSDNQVNQTWSAPYQFIKFRVKDQWGIKTFSGRTLLEPAYEAIDEYGPFLVLERDGLLAVTNRQNVLKHIDRSPFSPDFLYDDVALLEGRYLLAYQGEKETVLDERLNVVVPLDIHNVVRGFSSDSLASDQWLLKQNAMVQQVVNDTLVSQNQTFYYLYPPENPTQDTVRFQKAFYNDHWLALKDNKKFLLINYQNPDSSQVMYDSVQILGEHFVLTFQALNTGQDSVTVLLDNGARRTFFRSGSDGSTLPAFRLLRTEGIVSLDQLREYLLVNPASGPQMIINPLNEVILEQALADATVYPQGLTAIQQGRDHGLVDSVGQELLPPQYDGIGNYEAPGSLSLFKNKKFGLYQYPSGTLIEPIYESALTAYSLSDSAAQSLFVAKENGKYGVVTATNQRMAPFAFERVVYWNDTSALVKADGRWMIYRLTEQTTNWSSTDTNHVLYEGIEDFSFFQLDGTRRGYDPLGDTPQDQEEQLLRIYADKSYGVLSSQRGEVLAPSYDGISLFGNATTDDYLFFTEKYVPEAELYLMIYLDATGKLVKRLALTPDQYDRMYCE